MGDTDAATPPPLFVGGTGRSGTTITGQLVGQSSVYELVPTEVRFHADPGGLPDLVAGRVGLDEFEERMRTTWFRRKPNRSGPRGLNVICSSAEFDEALARLRKDFDREPTAAAGRLVRDLLDPVAQRSGKPSWVEMTPPVASAMGALAPVVPDAKFVHMVRDGRDVASSVVPRGWGPNDLPSAMSWWADQVIAVGRAAERVDPARVLHLRVESLVGPQRAEAYALLLDFLEIEDEPALRAFFEGKVTGNKARIGRWRIERDPEELAEVERLHADAMARLSDAGITLPEVM